MGKAGAVRVSYSLSEKKKNKQNTTTNKKPHDPTISASQLKQAHVLSATQTAQSEIILWRFPPKSLKGFRA